jgi:hypothetical protein
MNRLLSVTLLAAAATMVAAPATADRRPSQAAQEQAAKDKAQLDKALAGMTPGKPQDCIQPYRARDTSRIGDTILYKYSPREIYRVDTGGGCFGLRRGDAIVTKSTTGQLCRGDIVRTVDLVSHIPSGSCSFGAFIPYRK